jgi:hypothetical protein
VLNAVSASNVECLNETIYFKRDGTSIPVSDRFEFDPTRTMVTAQGEAPTPRYLVAPLSVSGETGSAYIPEFEPGADPEAGRYSIRDGRVRFWPARRPDKSTDSHAVLRLWVTRGAAGNDVYPGKFQSVLKKAGALDLRVTSLAPSVGGSNGERFQEARSRFAEALLSRDRIVTRADLLAAVRAFDRRILGLETSSGLQRTSNGLQRVQRIRILLDSGGLIDPKTEIAVLEDELQTVLRERCLYDVALDVRVETK